MAKADPTSSKSSSYKSQMATVANVSVLEKLDIIPVLITTLASTAFALFSGVWYSKKSRPESYYRHVALSGLRKFLVRTTVGQQLYISLPTDDAYELVCKRRGQEPASEILEDGTRAHWIGKRNSEKLVINFHGGGYVLPASEFMVDFMFQVVDVLNKKGKNASCLFLSYDLSPGVSYPRQLQQAASLLNHVLYTLHYSPKDIILTGDSAGANLCLALLSHISHPHPSTRLPIPKVELQEKFLGVVLISPWISFDTDFPSFVENQRKDCVSPPVGKNWSGAFLHTPWPHEGAKDSYNEALRAPESWWEGLMVEQMLIVCGSDEVLRDGIVKFEERIRRGVRGGTGVDFHVIRGEYHDQQNIDLQFGYREKDEGETAKMVKSWVASKL